MLAYAANRPLVGKREQSPNVLLLIVSAHVAVLAALMSSKVDVSRIIPPHDPLIRIPIPPAPPPPNSTAHPRQQPQHITQVPPRTDIRDTRTDPPPTGSKTEEKPTEIALGGSGTPYIPPQPPTAPIRHTPQLLTPASELKPPYPASKLAAEQEATLQLALTIDDRGHVIAVDPVGRADREFLDAARRYIISHWRYQPATEDGRPISSNLTITLRFQLDG